MALESQSVSRVVKGQVHIQPTTLTLEKGTMNVLLGPTLSGKTSLMRLMAGLDVHSTRHTLWDGSDVTNLRPVVAACAFLGVLASVSRSQTQRPRRA
jgi:glycerol transport system ATP-binding protein